MNRETIFDLLKSFAEKKSQSQDLTLLHYLYGYSQLLGMKPEMVKSLVNSDEDIQEYERLTQVVEKYEIDIDILKQGLPILLGKQTAYKGIDDLLERAKDSSTGHVAIDVLFKEIADSENFVVEVFKKGKTIEDVLEYNKQIQVEKEQPQKEAEEVQVQTVPVEKQTKDTFESLALRCEKLYSRLKEYVYGQDDAIRIFTQGYFQAELTAGVKRVKKGPRGIFLFAGPPGVGKTFLATVAAECLEMKAKRFNMSEYSEGASSVTQLVGLSSQYKDSKRGILTGYVKQNPKSILIFDEIEKAHIDVIHLFLQILDAGCLKDAYSEENVDFSDTLIIFTTNVGRKLYEENKDQNLSLLSASVVIDAIQSETYPDTNTPMFPAAICSRFATGNVVMFNHLGSHYLLKITEKNFAKCAELFKEKYQVDLKFDKQLSSVFLFHMSSSMDARIISSQSSVFIQDELYEFARLATERVDFKKLKEIRFAINTEGVSEKVAQLFEREEKSHVLVVGDSNLLDTSKLDASEVEVHYVKDSSEVEKILIQRDIRFVLVDPMYGYRKGMEKGVFSMEDYDTEGIRSFHMLRTKMPHMPLYILENGKKIREVDKSTFYQLGARGIVSNIDENGIGIEEQLTNLLSTTYLQEKVNELSRQEKVLDYNTAQMISADGEVATIEFYDFQLHTAVKAENKKMVLSEAEKPNVRFSDIIGAKNAQDELRFFIKYLKNPKEFMLKGVKAPKGILLYGPPGTGKTMLAKAMAGEADVTFLATAATDFAKPFVGESEESIRRLFATAKKYAPSVIFIDEIDAIAKERTGGSETAHDEKLLNVLLTEMDGFTFDPHRPVFVMAATNFPIDKKASGGRASIDPALLRRFANKIYVDLPNEEERKEFLRKRIDALQNCELTEHAINNIASRSTGESLAHLQNILDLAMRNAEKAGNALTDEICLAAMEEYYYGEEHKWDRSYYESVAHHEAGHAYISYLSGVKPSFLTIVSRGDFGGYMQSESGEKTPSYSKQDLLWRIRTCLAGRAAEIVFYGEEAGTNTGVSSDLESATNMALQMICRYGMSGTSLLSLSPDVILNSPMGEKVLIETQQILEQEMQNTIELIQKGRDKMEALVKVLLEKNQLMANEIDAILRD